MPLGLFKVVRKLSKLEQLINELCPNGVEFKTMGELGSFYGGLSGKSKEDFTDGNAKFITYMNVFSNSSLKLDTNDTVRIGENEKQNTVHYGDILFTGSSETLDECGMTSVLTENTDEKLYLNSFCFGFRFFEPKLFIPDFLKYVFRSTQVRKQISKTASGVTRFNVSKKKMEKVEIPIPPLAVQAEIVRILDNFTKLATKLITELTTELTVRKQQYEYYRDSLLTFGDEVEWKSLKECVLNTINIKWSENEGVEFQYIDLSSVNRDDNKISETQSIDSETAPSRAQQIVLKNDVIFGSTRPMLKRYCLINEIYHNQICSTGFCVLRANQDIILPKWIYFLISSTNFYKHVEKYQKGASYPAISDSEIKSYKIPVPQLQEQQRIVGMLDDFEKLCNDISERLTVEFKARGQQYEYYRDKLLTFKKKEVCADE